MISETNRKTFKIEPHPDLHIEPCHTVAKINVVLRPILLIMNHTIQGENTYSKTEIHKRE